MSSIKDFLNSLTNTLTNTLSIQTASLNTETLTEGTLELTQELPPLDNTRFVEQDILGEGGMGMVRAAYDNLLHRSVAIKSLKVSRDWQMGSSEWKYFYREAQITAQLSHPSIVPVYSIEFDKFDSPALVMKHIKGITLTEFIQECKSAYANQEVIEHRHGLLNRLEVLIKVCDAMHYAHSKGIIHRDLKPDNIMVGEFEDVYVMDWGVACAIDEDLEALDSSIELLDMNEQTQDGAIVGTLTYMPPEQAKGWKSQTGYAADQYTIGCILYELLTFRRARTADNKQELIDKALSGKWETGQLEQLQNEIDPRLSAIIRKATAQEAHDRYPSMQYIAQDLRHFSHNEAVYALPETRYKRVWRVLNRHPLLVGNFIATLVILSLSLSLHSLQRSADARSRLVAHRQHSATMLNQLSIEANALDQKFLNIKERIDVLGAIAEDQWSTQTLFQPKSTCLEPHKIRKEVSKQPTEYTEEWVDMNRALCLYPSVDNRMSLQYLEPPLMTAYFDQKDVDNDPSTVYNTEAHDLHWVYVGFENGSLIHYPGTVHFETGFMPSDRPWYVQAGSKGSLCASMYKDMVSGKNVLPCSVALYDSQGIQIGVAGADIRQHSIEQWLNTSTFPKIKSINVVDANGKFLFGIDAKGNPATHTVPPALLKQIASGAHHGIQEQQQSLWLHNRLREISWSLVYELDKTIWECTDCFAQQYKGEM